MANTVYTTYEYELDDGTVVILKPLVISKMRKFMEIVDKELPAASDVYEMTDIMVKAAVICLEKHNPQVVADVDKFKDNVDLDTLYKILEVCGGINFNNPNLTLALPTTESPESDGLN